MKICGLQKTTLLDYPQHLAATVFTGGCNFLCQYCHNMDLVKMSDYMDSEVILEFLHKRRNILEGVCITGGEPTLQVDLSEFIMEIKKMGYLVKLDTNGYKPDVIEKLLSLNLLDYIAMDVKTSKKKYASVCGVSELNYEKIDKSISIIMDSSINYEFRTTCIREYLDIFDIEEISMRLSGCSAYYLQNFTCNNEVINKSLQGFLPKELQLFQSIIKKHICNVYLRG